MMYFIQLWYVFLIWLRNKNSLGNNLFFVKPKIAMGLIVCFMATTGSAEANTQKFCANEVKYLEDIALGFEYGNVPHVIDKWDHNIQIRITGQPSTQDLKTVNWVVGELNKLIGGSINLSLTTGNQYNVTLYFGPNSTFSRVEPHYVPTNYGFFWVQTDFRGIESATVLISTDYVSQEERNHLIREELTQILGLANDSYSYQDSIFYQPWTCTTNYSDLDKKVIKMLYLPEVKNGMSRSNLYEAFR
jgi:hypothetical protein